MSSIRLAAQWDTSCSFEANYNWKEILYKEYPVVKSLVDVNGKP
jgi:hypothetical protein